MITGRLYFCDSLKKSMSKIITSFHKECYECYVMLINVYNDEQSAIICFLGSPLCCEKMLSFQAFYCVN